MNKLKYLFLILLIVASMKTVSASPLVTVTAEGLVDGYVGENIGSKIVELKLTDEDYRFEIEDGEEVTGWFDNIPEGLEAYVIGHLEDNIHVSFEGTPKEERDAYMEVTVPDGSIIDTNSGEPIGDLKNIPDENASFQIGRKVPYAEYERESIVSGRVNEELEKQNVYVKLHNTTCKASMMGHEFETVNGLTPKVIDILSSNVIVIEYSGVPEEEDHSLIHTILSGEDLNCEEDLTVPDREDVRFAILGMEEEEAPPVVIPFVIPVTGVE